MKTRRLLPFLPLLLALLCACSQSPDLTENLVDLGGCLLYDQQHGFTVQFPSDWVFVDNATLNDRRNNRLSPMGDPAPAKQTPSRPIENTVLVEVPGTNIQTSIVYAPLAHGSTFEETCRDIRQSFLQFLFDGNGWDTGWDEERSELGELEVIDPDGAQGYRLNIKLISSSPRDTVFHTWYYLIALSDEIYIAISASFEDEEMEALFLSSMDSFEKQL